MQVSGIEAEWKGLKKHKYKAICQSDFSFTIYILNSIIDIY